MSEADNSFDPDRSDRKTCDLFKDGSVLASRKNIWRHVIWYLIESDSKREIIGEKISSPMLWQGNLETASLLVAARKLVANRYSSLADQDIVVIRGTDLYVKRFMHNGQIPG